MAEGEGFRIASAFVTVEPDTSDFRAKLQAALDEAVKGVEAKVKVGADTSDLDAKVSEAKARARDLDDTKATAKLGADDADLKAKTAEAKAKVDEVGAKTARPKLDADKAGLDAKTDDAKAKLDDLDGKRADPKLGLDDSGFKSRLAEDKAALDSAASSSGGGFSFPFPMASGITARIASLLPGIGGAATGLAGLGGAGALAFGGISSALQAYSQSQQNMGQTSAQLAATEFSNSVQIQNAQQAIAQAHAQAAQTAVQSAQQIASAQMSLAVTERNAAQSDIAAQQAVGQAHQQLGQATFSLAAAQYNLSNAWIQAKYQLQQLDDQERNSATTVAAARLAVQQAVYQQQLTDQNAMSTSLDRAQAAIAVKQAEEQLTAAQQQATYVKAEATLQDKKGVAGSQQVLSAQEAVKVALQGVANAQQAYANAQRNLTITQLNNAEQVKAAQMAVASAEEQAAYQQQQSALAVGNAQRNLTNTYKQQQLQMAATASTSNQARNQFLRDMALLTPAGRAFVNELIGMRSVLHSLEGTAQQAILPGVTIFFRGVRSILPQITGAVRQFGGMISGFFSAIGRQMQTAGFRQVFSGLITQGVQFARIVLPALGGFVRELAVIGSKSGAVSGLANLLAGLGRGLTAVMTGLAPFVGSVNSVLSTLGSALVPVGRLIGEVVGGLGRALAPALRALLPGFTKFIDLLGSSLATALSSLAPDLTVIGAGIGGILSAAAPLLPVLAQLIGALAQGLLPFIQANVQAAVPLVATLAAGLKPVLIGLVPIVRSVAEMLTQNQAALTKVFVALLPLIPNLARLVTAVLPVVAVFLGFVTKINGPIVGALANVAAWFIKLGVDSSAQLLNGVSSAFHGIAQGAEWLWHNILQPAFTGIAGGATWLYQNGFLPLWHGTQNVFGWMQNAANFLWHDVFDPMWRGLESGASGFITAFRVTWNMLKGIFANPVKFLVGTVYDEGIARLWNVVVSHIGLGSLKLPVIPTTGLAGGGIVPGTDRGRDERLVPMRPGEGVLVPEAVAGIGGAGAVYALNQRFGGSRASVPGAKVSGFSGGGVLGSIGGAISGAWHDVTGALGKAFDIGKMIAAIATGNTSAFANAAGQFISTKAAGDLGRIMLGIPKTLVLDLAKELSGSVASGKGTGGKGVSLPVSVSGNIASWFSQAVRLAGVPVSWIPDLETIAKYESGFNPNAINLTDSNAAAGDPSRGLMQEIMSTFLAYHVPGTSMNIYDPVANIASASRYIRSRYGSVYNVPGIVSLSHGGGYVGYDSGGVWPPGVVGVNSTGKPEAVLNPEQWQILVKLAGAAKGGERAGLRPVNVYFTGTQVPTGETMAIFKRELAQALS